MVLCGYGTDGVIYLTGEWSNKCAIKGPRNYFIQKHKLQKANQHNFKKKKKEEEDNFLHGAFRELNLM